MSTDLYIGLISGTSLDGIDAALVAFDGDRPNLVAKHQGDWPEALQQRLRCLAAASRIDKDEFGRLDALAGERFGDVALQLLEHAGRSPDDIVAIGSHGQTVAHATRGEAAFSLQIGDPNRIAARTGITTVADFRRRDIAVGGEGAPLVPAFHAAVLRAPDEPRAVLNLGGIANLTVLPCDGDVLGFDTGPASCLLDLWARRELGQHFDHGGDWAAGGQIDRGLRDALLADPYFAASPPKSTGTQYFSADWLDRHLQAFPQLPPRDVQATLTELTAQSIADAVEHFASQTGRILVCGGGTHNDHLMARLSTLLAPRRIGDTTAWGLPADWVEAMAFAWLARRTLAGLPGNLPSVTGATEPVVLGAIHPGRRPVRRGSE